MKTTILLFFTLLCMGLVTTAAQTPDPDIELMQKYWNYRDVFRKYFVRIGEKQGQSLPAVSIDNQMRGGDGNWFNMTLYCELNEENEGASLNENN